MARPRKSRGLLRARSARSPVTDDAVPDVYREMIRDAVSSSPPPPNTERPLKRRRVGGHVSTPAEPAVFAEPTDRGSSTGHITDGSVSENQFGKEKIQTLYHDTGDSSQSDVAWEEVGLEEDIKAEDSDSTNAQELNLTLNDAGAREKDSREQRKRRPTTSVERKLRLDIHKLHVLCLLAHVHLRNHWCNDEEVHKSLRNTLSKKTVSYLNPKESLSQFQRTRSFNDGLAQAVDIFKLSFTTSARGIRKAHWAEDTEQIANIDIPLDLDLPMEKADFQDAAAKREGSRDVGAQLFCALLRSAGVDTRLTCSIQPLPFNPSTKTKTMPTKASLAVEKYYNDRAESAEQKMALDHGEPTQDVSGTANAIGSVGGRNRFVSSSSGEKMQRSSDAKNNLIAKLGVVSLGRRKRHGESMYPVYWTEAFDEAAQKWIPIDPLVTKTIGKPRKFEPPTSDHENNMSYVIAFEDDGSARDVTKRYAKAYNAKTRKTRVEATKDGERWLNRVLKMYRHRLGLDRDQLEDSELARKEAQEGLPQNVQDFKDHPYYALERHLRRNEIIHPKREVGKVPSGRAGNATSLEPIYRRHDVHIVKSADSWYRLGREIKAGEQPLKRAKSRRLHDSSEADNHDAQAEGEEDENDVGTSLYAFFQTIEYKPPPVLNGKIPKNIYGNLDLYVPTMIPAGAVHIKNSETQQAARLLGIDYADAVTGFAFKGRHGTAIINGAVIALEHLESVQEVLNAFEDERAQAEEARRSLEALRMWKRLLAGLRIRERIEGYEVEGERDTHHGDIEVPNDALSDDGNEEGGGFFPDSAGEPIAEPTVGRIFNRDSSSGEEDESVTHRDLMQEQELYHKNSADLDEEVEGGGFLVDEVDQDAEEASSGFRNNDFGDHAPSLLAHDQGPNSVNEDLEKASKGPHKPRPQGVEKSFSTPIGGYPMTESAQQTGLSNKALQESMRTSPLEEAQAPPRREFSMSPNLRLADDELVEATILQQSYEMSRIMTQLGVEQFESNPPPAGVCSGSGSNETQDQEEGENKPLAEAVLHEEDTEQSTAAISSRSGHSEDETSSLLAEDPSDEDADPEWLA